MIAAIVPAKDRADSVGTTVAALRDVGGVDEVVVVDDGSRDATAEAARAAGARVVVLPRNVGKGGAVTAGIAAVPDADVYLLIDADVAGTAGLADRLLAPVIEGQADMTIAVLPSAGRRGGFGSVRRFAAWGIERASGHAPRAPLSGQRAVRGELLRSLSLADRFGLETALTIDAARAGARVLEVDVAMDHRHTGRRLSGFRHRAGQGVDIARALWSRLTSRRARLGLIGLTFVVAAVVAVAVGSAVEPTSVPMGGTPQKVVIFGMPHLAWDDLGSGDAPNLDEIVAEGAVAAMSVRTISGRPTTAEGYATLGAGTRVAADEQAAFAFDAGEQVEGGSAAVAFARRTGSSPSAEVLVLGAPAVDAQNRGRHLSSHPGALADALHDEGRRIAVIGNADGPNPVDDRPDRMRPVAVAGMTSEGSVDVGAVGASLLRPDATAPFGRRADEVRIIAELERVLDQADAVVVDSGDLDRAAAFAGLATPTIAAEQRRIALQVSDDLLGRVRDALPPESLLLVVSVVPPGDEWHLAPVAAVGAGVEPGYLHSPSTRRVGVVTLTDLAPTVLAALDVPVPDGMIGHPLALRPGDADLGRLEELDRDAAFRESLYLRLTIAYIVLQALVYLVAIVAFARLGGAGRMGRLLRVIVLGVSAWPVTTFLFRAIPDVAEVGALAVPILLAIDAAIVAIALRARRRPLSPLAWVLGATIAVLVLDVVTGARLQTSSLLGYSLHTAARFTGLGNTAFATLAATTVLVGAMHVHHAPRRDEALFATACLYAFVVLVDGAPALGSDVGGILTLVPVFGLTLLVLAGRRLSVRALVTAGLLTVLAIALAIGVDLLRPAASRTHLGRLVSDISSQGWEPLTTTVERKAAVNFRTYRSPWAWALVVIVLYLLWFLGWARGWREVLPVGSALRAGVIGTLAAGLVGYAVNDSGVVVAALVFVYVGPFLTMVAIEHERGGPVVLPPDRTPLAPAPSAPARL